MVRPAAAQRRIALTGARSFLGRSLLERLAHQRHVTRVVGLDVAQPPLPQQWESASDQPKYGFHRVDLTHPRVDGQLGRILRDERIDTVVHAAFLSTPSHAASWAHELEDLGTMHLLDACAQVGVARIVMLSTTLVYGARARNPNYLTEEHPLAARRSSWLRDRVAAELQARRHAEEHPDCAVTVLRAAPTVGPTIDNFVTRFFSRPVAPTLLGSDPLVQLLHEDDLVDAFEQALESEARGAYNIVGEGVLPYSTVLALMGKIPVPVPYFVARPVARALWMAQLADMPPSFLDFLRYLCVADGTAAARDLGFRSRYDIRATIADFLGLDESPGLAVEHAMD